MNEPNEPVFQTPQEPVSPVTPPAQPAPPVQPTPPAQPTPPTQPTAAWAPPAGQPPVQQPTQQIPVYQSTPGQPNYPVTPPTYSSAPPPVLYPMAPVQPPVPGKGAALASLILGIVSIVLTVTCCGMIISWIPALVGLILGIVARAKGNKSGMSIAGLILCGLSLGLILVLTVLSAAGVGNFNFNVDDPGRYENFLEDILEDMA